MNKRALLAAAAMLTAGFNPLLIAPAHADPIVLTPIQDLTGLTPQEVCDAVLRPAVPSGFFTYPGTDLVVGLWVDDGAPHIGAGFGPITGSGTPVFSNIFLTTGFFRNGGSPNVWGGATARETFPDSQQMHHTTQDQTRTTTFSCVVEKDPGGEDHGPDAIFPPGLQTSGNSSIEHRTIDGPDQNVITSDDFVIDGVPVITLICISPNNITKGKPGTWTKKHGFTGSCTDASTAADTSFIPSGNNPIVD